LHRCVKFHDTEYAVYAAAEPTFVLKAGSAGRGDEESVIGRDP
jgi:hypothetical protein